MARYFNECFENSRPSGSHHPVSAFARSAIDVMLEFVRSDPRGNCRIVAKTVVGEESLLYGRLSLEERCKVWLVEGESSRAAAYNCCSIVRKVRS